MTESRSEPTFKIGGILLAAGGSERLGTPKQLIEYQGRTLLRRAAESLCTAPCSPVVAVLGEQAEAAAELAGLDLIIAVNKEWRTGMASSIICGLERLVEMNPDLDAVVIALCDQPLVTAEHLTRLTDEYARSRSPITAAKYGDTVGVPAVFAKERFGDLLALAGDKGARHIIRNRPDGVRTVTIDEAAFDIDTPADAQRLISR